MTSHLDQPGEELPVSDERPPALLLPVHVFQAVLGCARLPAKQHHHAVRLRWDEPKDKDVPCSTTVAFEDCFSKWPVLMQGYLLVLGPNQVVHYVRPGGVSSRVAEPTLADVAVNLGKKVRWKSLELSIFTKVAGSWMPQ